MSNENGTWNHPAEQYGQQPTPQQPQDSEMNVQKPSAPAAQVQAAQNAQRPPAAQAQAARSASQAAYPQAPTSYVQQGYAPPRQEPAYATAGGPSAGVPGEGGPYAGAFFAGSPYAGVPYQQAPQKKGRGWIVLLVICLCLIAFTVFCVSTCASALGSLSGSTGVSGVDGLTKDTIAVIEIDGTIQYDDSACSPEGLKELLDEAQKSEFVKGIVLRVNSGGGTATAGEEMAEYLRQFDKPIVVSSASINASAAYEISAQADYIYVAKSTEIGGIGTAIQLTDLSGLFEKLGINMEVIASAESKDSSYGYRALSEEEKAYYQDMVNKINDMFIENVAKGRKMDEAAVRKLATGLVFTGVDAVENGLADGVGTREDAVAKAAELAGTSDYTTTDLYLSSYDISDFSSLLGETRLSADDILDALESQRGVKVK